MRKLWILMLALTLAFALCACGEDKPETDVTTGGNATSSTTTVSTTATEVEPTAGDPTTTVTEAPPTDPTGSRTIVTKPATTTKAPVTTTKAPVTTTKAPVTTTKAPVTTTKAPVTTTKAPTTTTTTAAEQPVDPSGLVQSVEYWGNDYRVDGTTLSFTALMFDGDYCVIIDRQFTSAPEVAEGTTLQYGGKTYYSEGGGMNPLQFTVSGTEIVLSDGGKLALYRNGTVKVLTPNSSLKKDMLFTVQPQ